MSFVHVLIGFICVVVVVNMMKWFDACMHDINVHQHKCMANNKHDEHTTLMNTKCGSVAVSCPRPCVAERGLVLSWLLCCWSCTWSGCNVASPVLSVNVVAKRLIMQCSRHGTEQHRYIMLMQVNTR